MGSVRTFFNEQDRFHMGEVRDLFLGGFALRRYAAVILAAAVVLLLVLKADLKRILPKAYEITVGVFLALGADQKANQQGADFGNRKMQRNYRPFGTCRRERTGMADRNGIPPGDVGNHRRFLCLYDIRVSGKYSLRGGAACAADDPDLEIYAAQQYYGYF